MNKNIDMIIDWCSFSVARCQFKSPSDFLEKIGLDLALFEHFNYSSVIGYSEYYTFEKINFHISEDRFFIDMSGRGTRSYEHYCTFNDLLEHCWIKLFKLAPVYFFQFTRLDIAFDFYNITHLVTWQKVRDCLSKKHVVTCASRGQNTHSYIENINFNTYQDAGYTGYIGSRYSLTLVRVYDKIAEREHAKYEVDESIKKWTRFEIVFRQGNAVQFIDDLIENDFNIEYVTKAKINQYMRFVEPTGNDSNRRRWNSPTWWTKFLNTTDKICLSRKRIQTTIQRKIKWHEDSVSKSLFQALIYSDNPYQYIKELLELGFEKAKEKDIALIASSLYLDKQVEVSSEDICNKLKNIKDILNAFQEMRYSGFEK